jgi:hypothetical protein
MDPMEPTRYVWEKVMLAVTALCGGARCFEDRLADAYLSQLIRLGPGDAPADLELDLEWIREFCQRHVEQKQPIDDLDRSAVTEKLVSLLIETSRRTA